MRSRHVEQIASDEQLTGFDGQFHPDGSTGCPLQGRRVEGRRREKLGRRQRHKTVADEGDGFGQFHQLQAGQRDHDLHADQSLDQHVAEGVQSADRENLSACRVRIGQHNHTTGGRIDIGLRVLAACELPGQVIHSRPLKVVCQFETLIKGT